MVKVLGTNTINTLVLFTLYRYRIVDLLSCCCFVVDTPMPAGHYLQSGASLKVKVEVAYPLLSPEEVASKEDSASTLEVCNNTIPC